MRTGQRTCATSEKPSLADCRTNRGGRSRLERSDEGDETNGAIFAITVTGSQEKRRPRGCLGGSASGLCDGSRQSRVAEAISSLLGALDRTDEAIKVLDQVIEIEPSNEKAFIDRAYFLVRSGKSEAAIKDIEQATVVPNDPVVLYQAGCVNSLLQDKSRHEIAVAFLSKAIQASYGADKLATDEDLDSLRDNEEFKILSQDYRTGNRIDQEKRSRVPTLQSARETCMSTSIRHRRATLTRIEIESLESRRLLAAFGTPWPEPRSLSISFPADDTAVGSYSNDIRQTLDAVTDRANWQESALRAYQTWPCTPTLTSG